jgi:hypothetical protein
VSGCLTNDFDLSRDRILHHVIGQKRVAAHICRVVVYAQDRVKDVP